MEWKLNDMNDSYPLKIIGLWTIFLLGTLFHTQLGLMPLFHGLDVALSHAQDSQAIEPIFWGMLAFFSLPMAAIAFTSFTQARWFRQFHFGLTVFYSVLNFAHIGADLFVPPRVWPQVILMLILFVIGVALNVVSWQWRHDRKSTRQHPS
jgi:hypothetical protein